jgi:LDH2 family malate/lactate/ureidoglycolate dehydrogenase
MSTKPSNVIPVAEVKRFTVDCLETASVPLEHAEMLADVLVAADYRGHYSHGMNRLGMYVNKYFMKQFLLTRKLIYFGFLLIYDRG